MDWGKLIADNFDKILIIISAVVGGGITYFVQSRLQERQRRWALDDQRREWVRRNRLERTLEQLNNISQEVFALTMKKTLSPEELDDINRIVGEFGTKFETSYDEELSDIKEKWFQAMGNFVISQVEEGRIPAKQLGDLYSVQDDMRERIYFLIEETYAPPPSLLQRIIKRLTPKRSNNRRAS